MSAPLLCGTCTACCHWGENAATLAPVLEELEGYKYEHVVPRADGVMRLKATAVGDCVYLHERGCSIHPTRPRFCRAFDCRDAYDKIKTLGLDTPVLHVLIAGAVRREQEKKP